MSADEPRAEIPFDLDADEAPVREVLVAERPWGTFEQFCLNEPVTVKLITVQPGCRLSLQHHAHRTETWQVLDVPLDVQVAERSWVAQPGDLVHVPVGAAHRLGNSGDRPGRVLEIARGGFDEEDIVRLHDDYARHDTPAAAPTP